MKNLQSIIQEKLRIGKSIQVKDPDAPIKLVDVQFGDDLYLLVVHENGKFKSVKGFRTQRNSSKAKDEITWGGTVNNMFNSWTYIQNVHFDTNSYVAGLRTDYLFYFIAAKEEYFDFLKNNALWDDLTDVIYTNGISMDKKLKEYIDEHIDV